MTKAVERHTKKINLLQKSRHPAQVPSTPTPALAHAPPAHQAHIGLAVWSFFVILFELRKVRQHRVFLERHRSVSVGTIYTDLTSAVGGSAIENGVDAGLLKTELLMFF
jgi:hypothetical protein